MIDVRAASDADRGFLRAEIADRWLTTKIYSRDVAFEADQLPALIAWRGQSRVGHLTYTINEDGDSKELEVVTLAARLEGAGVGSALLDAVLDHARQHGCKRAFLTTSNDNLHALGFYQKRAWRIVRVWPGMIDRYRELYEPEIPRIGMHDIPLRDEVELEYTIE